jgi:hypothetical protein
MPQTSTANRVGRDEVAGFEFFGVQNHLSARLVKLPQLLAVDLLELRHQDAWFGPFATRAKLDIPGHCLERGFVDVLGQHIVFEGFGGRDGLRFSRREVREATEIQNIQLADGNVCRELPIPVYMIFPRLFTCVTTSTKTFKVEFEVNIIVVFEEGYTITENHSIALYRAERVAAPVA